MPYGEFPPYHFSVPLSLLRPDLFHSIQKYKTYSGGRRVALGSVKHIPIGVRACSEIFAPQLFRELRVEHSAGIIMHTASLSMFDGSHTMQNVMRAAARMRAVENGLPLIQAINGGEGAAFDCRGKKIPIEIDESMYAVYTIPHTSSCPVRQMW
jgi:apolipoprotein N-acyltransferase